jgi:hypothetical protein
MDDLMDEQLHNPVLDDLLRPALLVEPTARVQQAILAAVLRAAEPTPVPLALPVAARSISPLSYLLLGAVLLAYAGILSWFQGVIGETGWLTTLFWQLTLVLDLVVGQTLAAEPLTLAWTLVQAAPWLLLLPLAWFLWDRDRAAIRAH